MYIAVDFGIDLPIAIPGVEQNIPKLALSITKTIILKIK